MVHEKTFREDLYYRLNVVPIEIPPLRERKRDIRPLVESFLKDMNKKYRYQKRFADAAMEILYSYVWPGNVRELKNVVEQAVILSAGDEIQPSELPIACRFEGESHGGDETGRVNLKLEVARFEYEYICRAYEKYGTVRAAAASLGMDSATFVRKRASLRSCCKNETGAVKMHQPTELRQVNWFQLDKFKLTDDLLMQKCSKQGEGFLGGKAQSTALIGLFFEVGM